MEAGDNRKPRWFFGGQNVRKWFAFQIIVLCLNLLACFTFSTPFQPQIRLRLKWSNFSTYSSSISIKNISRRVASLRTLLRYPIILLEHLLAHPNTQVPTQPNFYDCGCYTIFFAKKFLADPDAILALIKVASIISYVNLN